MGWSIQVAGSFCFLSAIYLTANGLYVKVPHFSFSLPSSLSELDKFPAIMGKFLAFRESLYKITDAIQETSLQSTVWKQLWEEQTTNEKILIHEFFGCVTPTTLPQKMLIPSYPRIYSDVLHLTQLWAIY